MRASGLEVKDGLVLVASCSLVSLALGLGVMGFRPGGALRPQTFRDRWDRFLNGFPVASKVVRVQGTDLFSQFARSRKGVGEEYCLQELGASVQTPKRPVQVTQMNKQTGVITER